MDIVTVPAPDMNPNSANQLWSRWQWVVHAPLRTRTDDEVIGNCARFFRKLFGAAGEMRAQRWDRHSFSRWVFDLRVEGKPAHDPTYQTWASEQVSRFMLAGFGVNATCWLRRCQVEAGSLQNGQPAEQLLMLPHVRCINRLMGEAVE